MSDTLKFKFS
jgi:transcriptional regulator of heat shock response